MKKILLTNLFIVFFISYSFSQKETLTLWNFNKNKFVSNKIEKNIYNAIRINLSQKAIYIFRYNKEFADKLDNNELIDIIKTDNEVADLLSKCKSGYKPNSIEQKKIKENLKSDFVIKGEILYDDINDNYEIFIRRINIKDFTFLEDKIYATSDDILINKNIFNIKLFNCFTKKLKLCKTKIRCKDIPGDINKILIDVAQDELFYNDTDTLFNITSLLPIINSDPFLCDCYINNKKRLLKKKLNVYSNKSIKIRETFCNTPTLQKKNELIKVYNKEVKILDKLRLCFIELDNSPNKKDDYTINRINTIIRTYQKLKLFLENTIIYLKKTEHNKVDCKKIKP